MASLIDRRKLMMSVVGEFIHLKGVEMFGDTYFPLDTLSVLNTNDYTISFKINSTTEAPLVCVGDNVAQGVNNFGIWNWSGTYTAAFLSARPTWGGNSRDGLYSAEVIGNTINFYKNGIPATTTGTRLIITDISQLCIGGSVSNNSSNYQILTGRKFVGEFYGIKYYNGDYILEPCIHKGNVGFWHHIKREFIAPVGAAVSPIYE